MKAGRVLRSRVRRRAIVTLKTGEAFTGTVSDADGQALVLQGATYTDPDPRSGEVPVDHEVVVLLGDVAYLNYL